MSAIWQILSFTKTFWRWYLAASIFVIATSALSLATPFISKLIVDQIVAQITDQNGDWQFIVILLGLVLLTQVFQIIMQSLGQWLGDILEVKLNSFLSTSFYKHLLNLHIGFYDNEVTGKTMNKMYRGIEQITSFIQNMLNNFLPFIITAIITVIWLAQYSLLIGILLAVLFPIYILISHRSTEAWKVHQDKQNAISDISLARAYESIAGIRIVKAFVTEVQELKAFSSFRSATEKIAIKQTRQWHGYDFARQFSLNVLMFIIYAYVIYFTFQGKYTIGQMTLILQLIQQARFPLFAMSWILGQIQQAEAGSKDFFAILQTPAQITDQPNTKPLVWPNKITPSTPTIEFKNVTFGYDDNKSVLNQISFMATAGQKLALVGESGQGKSTIVNLLLRFYQPQSGSIAIAGQDITTVSQTSVRQQIAVVFQESLLFSGTILENVRYAKPNASLAEVKKAATAANAAEFIDKLPGGYDSIVGERGVKLSGGQKQRIAIARAILKDAPIIILDEATSALDSKSELLVQEGLNRLMKGRTAIIIAHRLSTIAHTDHLVVIANGQIVESGNPSELLNNPSSRYSELVSLQQQLLQAPQATRQEKLEQFDLVED